MNRIRERQNEERFIELLAAQRHLYNAEKYWMTVLVVVSLVVAILWSGFFSFRPPISGFLAFLFILSIVGQFILIPVIIRKRETAAKIQEVFDCELLELAWNEAYGRKPSTTDISAAGKQYIQRNSHKAPGDLYNWYPASIENLPLPQARIVAQRQNIRWDSLQRRDLSLWILMGIVILVLILIIAGVLVNWTFQELFTGPILPFLPVFWIGIKYYIAHRQAAERLDGLEFFAESLKRDALSGSLSDDELARKARDLQNEIYRSRRDNPPVPNWFYNRNKEKNDARSQEE